MTCFSHGDIRKDIALIVKRDELAI